MNCAHLQYLGRPWQTRDAHSMNSWYILRGDLSAPSPSTLDLAKHRCRFLFLQQDRRRPSASLRISITTITTPNRDTPHSRAIAAAAASRRRRQRRHRHPPRHLDLRHNSLLAVEAPLKRRRKQVLLLPTSTRRPPSPPIRGSHRPASNRPIPHLHRSPPQLQTLTSG